MAKFELNQKVSLMYGDLVVPSIVTKRIRIENLDTQVSEIYYDYKHELPEEKGWSFADVPEPKMIDSYTRALDISIQRIVNKD